MLTELQESLIELRSMLDQEREDIAGLKLKGLDERRPRLEDLNRRVRSLSAQVSTLISNGCKEAGLTGQQNLSALIATIPKPEQEMFSRLQQDINKVSSDIDNSLRVNRGLLEDSLAFADQSLALFTGMLKSTSTYGQAGRYIESVDRSRIINREI